LFVADFAALRKMLPRCRAAKEAPKKGMLSPPVHHVFIQSLFRSISKQLLKENSNLTSTAFHSNLIISFD